LKPQSCSPRGAQVVVTGTDRGRLDAAAHDIGGEVLALRTDLRRLGEVDYVFEEIRHRYGRLDILFANAGLGLAAPLEAVTEEHIDAQFAVNFKGAFFARRRLHRFLGKARVSSLPHPSSTRSAQLGFRSWPPPRPQYDRWCGRLLRSWRRAAFA
jgi:NAD(P)-dependent dehydrogenase (short-subunit alcohol dehydrogenase family)